MFFSSSGKWCFFKNSMFLLYTFECLAVPGEIWIGAGGCLAPEDMAWIHSKVNISGNADLQDVPENLLFIWCLCKKNAFAKHLFRFWLWMHKYTWENMNRSWRLPRPWNMVRPSFMLIYRKCWNFFFFFQMIQQRCASHFGGTNDFHLMSLQRINCYPLWYVLVYVALNTWLCMWKIWIGAGGCHARETWQDQDLRVLI